MDNNDYSSSKSGKKLQVKALQFQYPIGIPLEGGGLEITNRIFVGGICESSTELDLEIFFSDFGPVQDVRIVTDRKTGESKGYGFVTFENSEVIEDLIKKRSVVMKDRRLRVRKAIRRNAGQFAPSVPFAGSLVPTEFSYFDNNRVHGMQSGQGDTAFPHLTPAIWANPTDPSSQPLAFYPLQRGLVTSPLSTGPPAIACPAMYPINMQQSLVGGIQGQAQNFNYGNSQVPPVMYYGPGYVDPRQSAPVYYYQAYQK